MSCISRRTLLTVAGAMVVFSCFQTAAETAVFRSPLAVVVSPDGGTLYVSDKTAGCVVVLDAATLGSDAGKIVRQIAVAGEPAGVALSADGKTLYVAQRKAGSVAVIDTAKETVSRTIPVGPWPVAVAVAEKAQRLLTCNRGNHTVSIVDLAAGKQLKQIAVTRDPAAVAITPDESRAVVTNYLPHGRGTNPALAAEVSILDLAAPVGIEQGGQTAKV